MIETRLGPRKAIAACLEQWRRTIIDCDDARLPDQVRDIESVSRMVYSVMLDAVAELESRSIAVAAGFRNTKQLLAGMLNLSATEAGTRVTHATHLAPRRTLTGEVLAPVLPQTAAALATGEIGPAQVRVITETMGAVPASVSAKDHEVAEAELARHARSFNSTSLHRIGVHILGHLDPDGPEPRDEPEPAPAAGELRLWDRRDGRLGLEGYLEPEHRAAFRSLIEQLAAPRPVTTGTPDERTTPQRNADALLEVCGLARAAHDCPTTAGEPPHLTVTIDWEGCAPVWGSRPSITGRISAPRRPDGGRVTRKSSPLCWAGNPNHSTSGGPCAPSHYPSAGRLSREIAYVRFQAVIGHRECVRRIIVGTGLIMVKAV